MYVPAIDALGRKD